MGLEDQTEGLKREERRRNKREDQGSRKPPFEELDPEHVAWKNGK